VSLSFPAGLRLIGSVIVDLPATGNVVQANVVLPQDYQLQLSSEAGSVTTFRSGPISIPAPTPP
jgi:hypothetical protein